jgi:hypothetical protein
VPLVAALAAALMPLNVTYRGEPPRRSWSSEELGDRGCDLLGVGLHGEVTAVDETHVGVGDVARLKASAPAGRKNGSSP